MKTVFKLDTFDFPIQLDQYSHDKFVVIYGQQIDTKLTYRQATAKLGEAIMHVLACRGELDNRGN